MEDDSVLPIPSDPLETIPCLREGIVLGGGLSLGTRDEKSWAKVRRVIKGEEGNNEDDDGEDSKERQILRCQGQYPYRLFCWLMYLYRQ